MANFPEAPQNTPVFVRDRMGGTYMHRAWVIFFQSLGNYFGDFQAKVDNPTVDNFASLNADGEVQDSGFDSDSFSAKQHTHQSDTEGGKIDHGLGLSGLTDDDHTQYLLLSGRMGQMIDDDLSVAGFISVKGGYRVNSDIGITNTISLASSSKIRTRGGLIVEII